MIEAQSLSRRAAGEAEALPNAEQEAPPIHLLPEPSLAELALAQERAEAFAQLGERPKAAVIPLRPVERTDTESLNRAVLTLSEAAAYARRTKPSGVPRDSFYAAIKRELGSRKRVYRDEIDDLIKKGRL